MGLDSVDPETGGIARKFDGAPGGSRDIEIRRGIQNVGNRRQRRNRTRRIDLQNRVCSTAAGDQRGFLRGLKSHAAGHIDNNLGTLGRGETNTRDSERMRKEAAVGSDFAKRPAIGERQCQDVAYRRIQNPETQPVLRRVEHRH